MNNNTSSGARVGVASEQQILDNIDKYYGGQSAGEQQEQLPGYDMDEVLEEFALPLRLEVLWCDDPVRIHQRVLGWCRRADLAVRIRGLTEAGAYH